VEEEEEEEEEEECVQSANPLNLLSEYYY